jgi:SAM-dependent methyltransferase
VLTGSEHFYGRFRDAVARLATCKIVVDLGTPYRFRKELEPFAPEFGGRYFAVGYHAERSFGNRNVDVEGDIQALPFASGRVDGVLCIEVLEHVPNPQAAVDEIHRVLQNGGRLLLTTPFMVGYHGKADEYGDFYRYTDDGLRHLLRRFGHVEVWAKGGALYRRLLASSLPDALRERALKSSVTGPLFNALDRRLPTRSPLGWIVWAEK